LLRLLLRPQSSNRMRDFGCSFKVINGDLLRSFQYDAFRVLRPAYVVSKLQRCSDVPVSHHPRLHGKSRWRVTGLMAYFFDNLISVWQHPFLVLGFVAFLSAVLLGAVAILGATGHLPFVAEATPNFMLALTLLQLLIIVGALMTLGEFVMRYYGIRQPHPAYIIRKLHRRDIETVLRAGGEKNGDPTERRE
jgi:hypothetical protein